MHAALFAQNSRLQSNDALKGDMRFVSWEKLASQSTLIHYTFRFSLLKFLIMRWGFRCRAFFIIIIYKAVNQCKSQPIHNQEKNINLVNISMRGLQLKQATYPLRKKNVIAYLICLKKGQKVLTICEC